jgi:hypothetical protein
MAPEDKIKDIRCQDAVKEFEKDMGQCEAEAKQAMTILDKATAGQRRSLCMAVLRLSAFIGNENPTACYRMRICVSHSRFDMTSVCHCSQSACFQHTAAQN